MKVSCLMRSLSEPLPKSCPSACLELQHRSMLQGGMFRPQSSIPCSLTPRQRILIHLISYYLTSGTAVRRLPGVCVSFSWHFPICSAL
jgi:hypothetical protein